MPFLTLLLALFSSTLKAGEWETLFDGHSTDAFRAYQKDLFPSEAWNVIDGTLRTNPKATPVDLITRKTYQSFELVFDWIATQGANSGVIYRAKMGVSLGTPALNTRFWTSAMTAIRTRVPLTASQISMT